MWVSYYSESGWKSGLPPGHGLWETAPCHQLWACTRVWAIHTQHKWVAWVWASAPGLCDCYQNLEMQERASCLNTDSCVVFALAIMEFGFGGGDERRTGVWLDSEFISRQKHMHLYQSMGLKQNCNRLTAVSDVSLNSGSSDHWEIPAPAGLTESN